MILQYFIKKETKQSEISKKIYLSIIEFINIHYNQNKYYIKKEFNSSFELTTLLIFVVFFGYKNTNNHTTKQQIIDNFIGDLDISLRNLGIGDMKIGRYVKKYVKKIYYRFDILDHVFKEHDFNKFEKYVIKMNILREKNNHYNFSTYLFKYVVDSINTIKYKKFSEFTYN